MGNVLLIVHVLVALGIIGLILIQQGKGAEMGASFGAGASQTLFGAAGSGNFFSKLTALFVAIFFVTSFSLALVAKNAANSKAGEDDLILPELEQVDPPVQGDTLQLPRDEPGAKTTDTPPDLGSSDEQAGDDLLPEIPAN